MSAQSVPKVLRDSAYFMAEDEDALSQAAKKGPVINYFVLDMAGASVARYPTAPSHLLVDQGYALLMEGGNAVNTAVAKNHHNLAQIFVFVMEVGVNVLQTDVPKFPVAKLHFVLHTVVVTHLFLLWDDMFFFVSNNFQLF